LTVPFTVKRPAQGVWWLHFKSGEGLVRQVDPAFHLLRFQEHYESPGFKGQVFSWAQYVAWYKVQRGRFSYPWDWAGYNFPGHILTPFRRGDFNPLTRREQAVLAALAEVGEDGYVIATQGRDPQARQHELAHAFWHLDPPYQAQVRAILEGGDYRRQEARLAEGNGYDPSVFLDEIQACAVAGDRHASPGPRRAKAIGRAFGEALSRRQLATAGEP
jgi:hypothetical protein